MLSPIRLVTGFLAAVAITAAQSAEDPLQTLRKEHPRLMLLDGDLARLRTLIRQDAGARKLYERLIEYAAQVEQAPPVEYKLSSSGLLFESWRCRDRVYALALLYRLDGKKPYLERAVRELRAAAAFRDWYPAHFLDTAEMTHAFAIGYDWLYDALSAEERGWIRRAMVEKGLNQALAQYEQKAWWTTARMNWNQVVSAGISVGALAVAEDEPEKSRAVLRHVLESVPRAIATYAPDGGWYEGPRYWHYATRNTVNLLTSLETALGSDFGLSAMPGVAETGRFRVHCLGPSGKLFNFADARELIDDIGSAAEMFWIARRFHEPVFAWYQQRYLETNPPLDPLDLIWYQSQARSPGEADWPANAVFRGAEVAFLRTAWDDPEALYAGMKAGNNKSEHGNLDLGTFVLDAGGHRWAMDLGADDYGLPGYFQSQRWTYYRMRTESHNTLLIDGENQATDGSGRISAHRFDGDLSFVRMDLTAAYPAKLQSFARGIALAGRAHFIVQDEIRAKEPVAALWGMVTDADVTPQGARAELRKPGWLIEARILSPQGAAFDVVSTAVPPPQGSNQGRRKLVVRLPSKVSELRLVVALTPHKAAQPAPKLVWRDRELDQW